MKKGSRWYGMQVARGKDRKVRLVNMLGGKCSVCGYDKNIAALDFHHKDPSKKETQLSYSNLLKMNWDKCVSEAKKCILLCATHHRELHYPNYDNWKEQTTPVGN
jgi:hypothetical protein